MWGQCCLGRPAIWGGLCHGVSCQQVAVGGRGVGWAGRVARWRARLPLGHVMHVLVVTDIDVRLQLYHRVVVCEPGDRNMGEY